MERTSLQAAIDTYEEYAKLRGGDLNEHTIPAMAQAREQWTTHETPDVVQKMAEYRGLRAGLTEAANVPGQEGHAEVHYARQEMREWAKANGVNVELHIAKTLQQEGITLTERAAPDRVHEAIQRYETLVSTDARPGSDHRLNDLLKDRDVAAGLREHAAQKAFEARPQSREQHEHAQPGRTYTGAILAVNDRTVMQQADGKIIEHDRKALVGTHALFDGKHQGDVEIRYPHGSVGIAKSASHEHEHAPREHQKDGPSMSMER